MIKTKQQQTEFLEEHFYYELDLFLFTFNKWRNSLYVPVNQNEKNIAIEGFLIHSRGLIDFFYKDTRNKFEIDDTKANEFIEKWEDIRPEKTEDMLKIKTRIHKEIAHLTWKRKYPGDKSKEWELFTIFNKLLKTIKIFLKNLPKELIDKKIKFFIDYLK